MSKPPLTTGDIAGIDQCTAAFSDELAVLVTAVRIGDNEAGEAQCLCNFIALLTRKYDPGSLAGLVVIAARKIGETA